MATPTWTGSPTTPKIPLWTWPAPLTRRGRRSWPGCATRAPDRPTDR